MEYVRSPFPKAVVPLPYTQQEKLVTGPTGETYRTQEMSPLTAASVEAGYNYARQKNIPLFVLTGEQQNPSTADLMEHYLINRKVSHSFLFNFGNRNGTPEQLDIVADLQQNRFIGEAHLIAFHFHKPRVEELRKRWGIKGKVVEVERVQADQYYWTMMKELQQALPGIDLTRQIKPTNDFNRLLLLHRHLISVTAEALYYELIGDPKMVPITQAENGLPRLMTNLDRPWGRIAPSARFAKAVMGPTITTTDENGNGNVGLVRLEQLKQLLHSI